MIAIDTSALLAIVLAEAESRRFEDLFLLEDCVVATPVLLEAHMALWRFQRAKHLKALDFLIERPNLEVIGFDPDHLRIAKLAFEQYGTGSRHPARLNFGDCMSYAVAKKLGIPLLFKGKDFIHTDIQPAFPN